MRIDGQAAPVDIYSAVPVNSGPKADGSQDQTKVEDFKRGAGQTPVLEDVQNAVNFSNNIMKLANYHLEFQVQESSHKCQVKLVDSDTGDIIREIPPDYMMKIAEQLQGKIHAEAGLLIDKIA